MELKWLEDFLSLASTRSFSKAAEERHTTQSTLSRRIQALEEWLGVSLVDRSSYPVTLSRAGEQFHMDAIGVIRSIYRSRAAARARGLNTMAPLRISGQYVLVRYFMPDLIRQIEERFEIGGIHLRSDSMDIGIDELANGHIDFFVCYHFPDMPDVVDRKRFPSIKVGAHTTVPVSLPDADGNPLFALPGTREAPVPFISFAPDAPGGWQRQPRLAAQGLEAHLDPLHESTMGEVIREFVFDGRGMAWLQSALVEEDLKSGALVRAGGQEWDQGNEIRIFRTLGPGRNQLEQVWQVLSDIARAQAMEESAFFT